MNLIIKSTFLHVLLLFLAKSLVIYAQKPIATTTATPSSISPLLCTGATIAELFIPGVGYLIVNQYEKAAIFGGSRWLASIEAARYRKSEDYEGKTSRIYKYETKGNVEKVDIFLSRETFYADFYGRLSTDLGFVSIYDLYDGNCGDNPETYSEIFSPFQFGKFGDRWTFWLPTGLAAWPRTGQDVTYHVDSDLTRQEMLIASFIQHQLVGAGEEMLFRGVIQRSFYEWFSGNMSRTTARWSSIFSGAAVFGLAHNGQGFSANSLQAFLMGIYLGWVYHPEEGDFNLTEVIAIHSWFNSINVTQQIQGAKFVERKLGENAKNTKSTNRYYPQLAITYRF